MTQELNERPLHSLDPQQLAERVGARMYERDVCAKHFGIRLLSIKPGYAYVEMIVRHDMLSGFSICHGGVITTLADTAFAYSCNSHNIMTVASGVAIEFLAPAHEADILRAESRRVSLSGRLGVYDVTVTNQKEEKVAVMRGKSYGFKNKHVVDV